MSNLVFLESVLQRADINALVEENSQLIDFAVSEVDNLVSCFSDYTRFDVGYTIEQTKNNITATHRHVIMESISSFSNIISSDLRDEDKLGIIQLQSIYLETEDPEIYMILCNAYSMAAGSVLGGLTGGVASKALGRGAGLIAGRLSAPYKQWKQLVNQEKQIRRSMHGQSNPQLLKRLKRIEVEKLKAHAKYIEVKSRVSETVTKGSAGSLSIAGSIIGRGIV